jgi:hypothetical protein
MIECLCPMCGAETDFEADCPGYGSPGKVMVCYPYCGNAQRYFCTKCTWWYRDPNNRSAEGMGIAPSWLKEIHASLESESIVGELEEIIPQTQIPDGMPGLIEGRIIHYVAYNYRHLAGIVIGYDPAQSYSNADIVIFTNMSNVNNVKNFGMQFHTDIEYSEVPKPGTWHWVEKA